ncbi:hypothetical protein [Mycobacterium asiaticum]|uniref:Transmembrane protein n=1 Tax=Mycobacterium asiaticum TaxID=1790 RepID=A0A1A3I236_MYCAS|nr:hypothetical protein [Mycobacterium asiaticum]OBI95371.1 hypothetical protein A5661_21750 [Mycobacterium asiaticum]OBJ53943.1 hypothetical protein A9W94_21895 [Mycobacterium asiaticum]OBJ83588.1 hypothetical protein A5640_17075 [Mycobacterium asiaticum]ORA16797.1 hypothetical protein BST16_06355 [Mycobacterium asiaticum DSM 44297]
MNTAFRGGLELVVAVVAALAAAFSWAATRSVIEVAPVADGQPPTTSVIYDPQQLVLTLLLATVAGIFVVVALTRLRRSRSAKPTS